MVLFLIINILPFDYMTRSGFLFLFSPHFVILKIWRFFPQNYFLKKFTLGKKIQFFWVKITTKFSRRRKAGPDHGWWYGHHRMDKWHMIEIVPKWWNILSHDDDTWDVCNQLSSPLVVHGMQKATRRSTLIRRGGWEPRCSGANDWSLCKCKGQKGPFDTLRNIGSCVCSQQLFTKPNWENS